MKIEGRSTDKSDLWIGAAISAVVHLALVVAIAVVWWMDRSAPYEEPEQDESMEVILEEEAQAMAGQEAEWLEESTEELADPVAAEEEPQQEDEEPEEEEDEEPEEEEFFDEQPLDRYAVDQQTDDEEPEDADHISDEAHRTEEETVAQTTTLEDVDPQDDPEAEKQEADTDRELAMETPQEKPERPDLVDPERMDEPDEDEVEEMDDDDEIAEEEGEDSTEQDEEELAAQEAGRKYRDPAQMFVDDSDAGEEAVDEELEREVLFGRDRTKADEMFGGENAEETQGADRSSQSGRQLLSNWRENEEAMRAALENFIPHVQPGNHTSVNATAADHASYIARMHRSIHARWAERFIPRVSRNFSSSHKLNNRSLETVVEIVIDAEAEKVVDVVRAQPSGVDMFDAEAINIARSIEDVSDPPDSIISPDQKIYIHWTFWRDERRCGTFGVRIYRVDQDGRRQEGSP